MARKKNSKPVNSMQKNFKTINEIIQKHIIPKIQNHLNNKKTKQLNMMLRSALTKGPFIRKDKNKRQERTNWVQWAFENPNEFYDALEQEFPTARLKTGDFMIDINIKSKFVSFLPIDQENIEHRETDESIILNAAQGTVSKS
jgi:hypothetical protein